MKFFWIGIFLLFSSKEVVPLVPDSWESYPALYEYDQIVAVASILTKKYDDYVHESITNKAQKELKKAEFFSSYDALYNDDSGRVLRLMKKEGSATLQQEVIKRNHNDYVKTQTFFEQLQESFVKISNVKVQYLALKGQVDAARKETSFRKASLEEIKKMTIDVLKYLKDEAWKTQFVIDTNLFLLNSRHLYNIQKLLLDMLAKKYPFRNWLVIAYDKTVSAHHCSSSPPMHEFSAGTGRSLLVIQTAKDSKWDKNAALNKFNKAKASRYTWICKNKAPSILGEVTGNCGSDNIPFLGVFMNTNSEFFNLPQYATNAPKRLSTRVVRRGSLTHIICVRHYSMLLFG